MFVLNVNVYKKNKSQTKKSQLLEYKIKRILLLSKLRNSYKVMKKKKNKIISILSGKYLFEQDARKIFPNSLLTLIYTIQILFLI